MKAFRSRQPPYIFVLAVCLSSVAGLGIALSRPLESAVPVGLFAALFAVSAALVAAHSLVTCHASLRAGTGLSHLGSAIFAAGLLVAVVLPGVQLLSGTRLSKLAQLGFPSGQSPGDVLHAFILFSLALAAFVLGERVLNPPTQAVAPSMPGRFLSTLNSPLTYGVLVCFGLVIAFTQPDVSQQQLFATRGQAIGQGIPVILSYSIPLAVALGVMCRHWGSKLLALSSVGLLAAFALSGGTRTPLLIVGVALLVRLMFGSASHQHALRRTAGVLLLLYVSSVLLVAISEWRGDTIDKRAQPFTHYVANAANPFSKLTEGGLDTLDGMILATKTDRAAVHASWTDPTKAILGFIPHQLWPTKPSWLGVVVTHRYLRFGAAGIFLSGPGYALIVFDGVAGMMLAFFLLGTLSEVLFRRMPRVSILTVLLVYFLVRFLFAGDAFDAHHTLALLLVLAAATGISAVVGSFVPARGPSGGPSTPRTNGLAEHG